MNIIKGAAMTTIKNPKKNSVKILMQNVITDIHDPVTGKVDAILFSDFLGISYEEMATFLNRTVPGLKKNPDQLSGRIPVSSTNL